jgi:hypothetical protein
MLSQGLFRSVYKPASVIAKSRKHRSRNHLIRVQNFSSNFRDDGRKFPRFYFI